MYGFPFPVGVWIFVLLIRTISKTVNGLFVAMISEGHVYLLNPGETVSLECNFHADEYDLFEYPVLWRKTQHGEETQVNIMGTIMDPFLLSSRFEVAFSSTASRYRLVLTISDASHTDNGNYTCEVRAPEAVILGHVTHHVFVRASVKNVTILLENANRSSSSSSVVAVDPPPSPASAGGTGKPAAASVASAAPSSTVTRSVHLTEGRPSTIGCICLGGYPPPSLVVRVGRRDLSAESSFRNSASLSGAKGLRTVEYRTERWTSRYVARAEDDDSLIKCIAQVPGLDPKIETVKLFVQYSPRIVCYTTGAQIGDRNVRLQCDIASRPRYTSVAWIVDSNGTIVREKESVLDHWTIVTERLDGVVVAELYTRRIRQEHFRKYTLVVENAVASVAKVVELQQRVRSTSERPQLDATASVNDEQGSKRHPLIQTLENEKLSSNSPSVHRISLTPLLSLSILTVATVVLLRRSPPHSAAAPAASDSFVSFPSTWSLSERCR